MAIIAVTKRGLQVAFKIAKAFGGDIYVKSRYFEKEREFIKPIMGNFTDFVHLIFPKYEKIVFVTATGIAVRAIAGIIKDKRTDPAVVVIDEQANFCISLISGHIGGANELTRKIAKVLNSIPVITTASDRQGFIGIDTLAQKLGLFIENFSDLKYVSSALVNGHSIALLGDEKEVLSIFKENLQGKKWTLNKCKKSKAAVFITDKRVSCNIPYVILRPKRIVLGIGARKNASFEVLQERLISTLENYSLSKKSIHSIATIDIKKDEDCILKLGEILNVPVIFYSAEELRTVESCFPISNFVKKTVGVGSVAQPAAYLASRRGDKISYYRGQGITLALYRRRII